MFKKIGLDKEGLCTVRELCDDEGRNNNSKVGGSSDCSSDSGRSRSSHNFEIDIASFKNVKSENGDSSAGKGSHKQK